MIEIENIKPIPKYILEKIKKKDKKLYPSPDGHTRYYTYFTKFKNELCSVTVAVRHKYNKWYHKQVIVHGIHNDKCFVKDMEYFNIAGYVTGWHNEGLSSYRKYFESDEWGWSDDKYFNPFSVYINKEYILTLPQYKYSAVDEFHYQNVFKYLRLYEKYPKVELLVKAGLGELATSKTILQKCNKDKKFCKWLLTNAETIKSTSYYMQSLIHAYQKKKTIQEMYRFESFKKSFEQRGNYLELKDFLYEGEKDKFLNYLLKHDIDGASYIDYLRACTYLNINMEDEKNRYPHDFKRWHDIRIDEYNTAKLKADEKARKKFYKQFEKVAKKYLPLQREKEDFITIIAMSPADLIREGDVLHHCVGKMGYDQKFVREETLIFFIRNKENPDIPFVTIEYSLSNHKVLQSYGDHDSKPDENVINYINKIWLPYANKKIKSLVA